MIRRWTLYRIADVGWLLLMVGIGVLSLVVLLTGRAEPYVSPSQLPPLPLTVVGTFIGVIALSYIGRVLIAGHMIRSWRAVGRRTDLRLDGQGRLLRAPNLVGELDGRTVRVRVKEPPWPSIRSKATVVETDLSRPAEKGLFINSVKKSWRHNGNVSLDPEYAAAKDEQLAVYGHSESVARALITGRSRNALLAVDEFAFVEVYVGNASVAVSSSTAMSKARLWPLFEGLWTFGVPDDPSRVVSKTSGMVLKADRLERQVQAVVAVADTFEDASPNTI